MEVSDENPAPDHKECSDLEDDTTDVVEGTYTKLLESNSAYTQLCGLASSMRIDEQKLLNVQKNEPVSKDLSASKTMNQGTETKNVSVFHQVVGPTRPLMLSKMPDTLLGRKIILKSLSFKDKYRDEAPISVHTESVSKDEQHEAEVNEEKHESTSVRVHPKETPVSVSGDTSTNEPDVTKPVRHETSSHDARNDTHDEVHVNDETDKVPTVPDIGNITSVSDEENAPHGECNEDDKASDEVNSLVNIRDASVDVLAEAKDKLGVIDDIPVVVQDVNNTNKEASLELDVGADTLADVQDANNLNKEAKSGLDVRDDKPANIQDVNERTKDEDETKCQPDVKGYSSVDRQHDVDLTEDMVGHKEICAIEEHVSGKDESNIDEVTNESERKVEAEPVIESDSVEKSTFDDSQDFKGCVDMDISDVDSEDENQEKVHEANVSGGEILPNVCEEDSVKLQEGKIKTEADVESNCKEHTREGAQPEISEYSTAGHASSTSHHLITLMEGHSSSDVDGSCIPIQNDSESETLHDASVVQHEIPEVSQYKPTNIYDGFSYELKDSSTSEEATDLAISNANDGSSKDPRMLEMGTDQKPLVPTIYMGSNAKSFKMHKNFDSTDVSPPTLQIDTEAEMNSRCCTPTLDEPAYNQWSDEVSNIQEGNFQDISETEHYCVEKSSTNAWLALESSEESHSELEKSPVHKEQAIIQDSCWSYTKHNAIVNKSDEGRTFLTDDYVPEDNVVYFDYEEIPTARKTKDTEPQQDQFGSFSEQYEDGSYEEVPSSWTHSASFKTEKQNEWYAPEEDTHYTNSISIHREVAYRLKESTESNTDTPGWVQRTHYSESVPNEEESNERVLSFRHRAGLSESNEESESQGSEPLRYSKKKHKRKLSQKDWGEEDFNATVDFSIQKTFSCTSDRSSISRTRTSSPYMQKGEGKQSFDWRRYFRRDGIFESDEGSSGPFHDPPSSIITMFDKKGNRVIFENPSTEKRISGIHDESQSVEEQQSTSVTQSLMELEYLIFSEKMTHLLKNLKTTSRVKPQNRLNIGPVENPMTIQFSRLDEQNSFSALDQTWPTLSKFKINVDMSERKALKKKPKYSKPLHLQSLFCERGTEATCSKLSDITKECSKSYHTMMNDICIGKTVPHQSEELKRKLDSERVTGSKQPGFCGRIKKDMFDHLHDNLNSIVRQACKTKYNFYILVTSADPFFEETKVGRYNKLYLRMFSFLVQTIFPPNTAISTITLFYILINKKPSLWHNSSSNSNLCIRFPFNM